MMFLIMIAYFWIGDAQSRSQKLGQRKTISNSVKIALKGLSLIIVICSELLLVPSLPLIFKTFECQIQSYLTSLAGLECESTQFSILTFLAVAHLILRLIFQCMHTMFMNDSFLESHLPWATSTLKPQILKVVILFQYCIWISFDTSKKYKIVADSIAFVLQCIILLFRFKFPTFEFELVEKTTLCLDISRAWLLFAIILLEIFKESLNVMSCIQIFLINLCLMVFWTRLVDKQILKRITNGLNSIKDDNDFQIFLTKIMKMINLDKKKHQIFLHGLFQTHFQSCSDFHCPCDSLKQENHQKDYNWGQQSNHQKEQLKRQSILLNANNIISGNHDKVSEKFFRTFQLKRSSDIASSQRRQLYKNEKDADQPAQSHGIKGKKWHAFLSYQLANTTKDIKHNVNFHLVNSAFYFLKMRNEFKALFEVLMAEEKQPSYHQQFAIYRITMRIEKVVHDKHEKSTFANRRINVLNLYDYEKSYSQFMNLIQQSTLLSIRFWSELLDKQINVEKMHETGIRISENHQIISKLSEELQKFYPNQLTMLMMYARYLNDIVNNEFNATEVFAKATQCSNTLKTRQRNAIDNEESLFGENTFCAVFVLSTNSNDIGTIEYCNEEVYNLVGYTAQELTGKDINTIIPKEIAKVHTKLMIKFFEKAESLVLNQIRELMVIDKEGYLIPIYLFAKVVPSLKQGLKLIGMIKRISVLTIAPECPQEFLKLPQDYILCDKENNIQNLSHGMTLDFGYFPKMFLLSQNQNSLFQQNINIETLSLDFYEKRSDLTTMGSIILIKPDVLVAKIEREILTNEEFQYFLAKQVQTKIFCQLIELSFGGLAHIRIYRILQVMKFASLNTTILNRSQAVKEYEEEPDENQASYHVSSASMSSSNTSCYSIDRQLKDFKKQIMENKEPPKVTFVKRLMVLVGILLLIMSVVIYQLNIGSYKKINHSVNLVLGNILRQHTLIRLQMNLRSMIDISNGIENQYFSSEYPYSDRYSYLNELCIDQLEDYRIAKDALFQHNEGKRELVNVTELDSNGKAYHYQVGFQMLQDLYISKIVELLNRTPQQMKSALATAYRNQSLSSTQQVYSLIEISQQFVIVTGFKQLIDLCEKDMLEAINDFQHLKLPQSIAVQYLGIVCAAIIIGFKLVLMLIASEIQNNKVKVLSLYSEIRIIDAKNSIQKCKFLLGLLNQKQNQEIIQKKLQEWEGQNTDKQTSEIEEMKNFNCNWFLLQRRILDLRTFDQRRLVENLKLRLTQIDNIQSFLVEDEEQKQNTLQEYTNNFRSDFSFLGKLKKTKEQTENNISLKQQSITQNKSQKKIRSKLVNSKKASPKKEVITVKGEASLSSGTDSDEDGKREAKIEEEIENKSSAKGQDEEGRIGKQEVFQKIQKKNLLQMVVIFVIFILSSAYFVFTSFYQKFVISNSKIAVGDMQLGFNRQISVNLLFSYMRERIVMNDSSYIDLENEIYQSFFQNEQSLRTNKAYKHQLSTFMFDFWDQQDSLSFCYQSFVQEAFNNSCSTFENGIFKQGFKSALQTYLNGYTLMNSSIQNNWNNQAALRYIKDQNVESFFINQESFFALITEKLNNLWIDHINEYFNIASSNERLAFILFVVYFILIHLLIAPKILISLNEQTWRSRGILNLVPNEIFKKMKRNDQIFKMLKS